MPRAGSSFGQIGARAHDECHCTRHDFRPCRKKYLHLKIISNIFTVRFSYISAHRPARTAEPSAPPKRTTMSQRFPSFASSARGPLAGALALLLAGCAVGPNYHRPDAPAVDRYTTQPLPAQTVSADTAGGDAQRFLQGQSVPDRWWTTFGNDELTRRVNQALAHSPTIASAQASLREAQENAAAARGGL